MPQTVVFVHAHPDDEALLTGGTMALLAASGRRVVLVTATDGAAGLASASATSESSLAVVRTAELDESARILGTSRLVRLGYADSGLDGHGMGGMNAPIPFARQPVGIVAREVAGVLAEEGAGAVVGYDASGGYFHPDHIQVHRITRVAAAFARTPVLLEATAPREPLARAVSLAFRLRRVLPQLGGLDLDEWQRAYTPRAEITSRIDVRKYLPQKLAAMAAHASQATADDGVRTIEVLLRLPKPISARILGREWFHRVWGRQPDQVAADAVIEKLAGM